MHREASPVAEGQNEMPVSAGPSDLDRRLIGTSVGNFTIRQRIGQGGMGAVYMAEHATLGTKVALKVLLPSAPSTPHAEKIVRRFVEEAKSLARVKHLGLVQVQDAGILPDGTPFIQTEYLEGETLRERVLREGRLPIRYVLTLGSQLASALSVVHQAGLVHCDVKPGNVFLVSDPEIEGHIRATLLDFGLAQTQRNAELASIGDGSASQSGGVQGTARYMSPEQCEGSRQLDGTCDVYALGLVLFEAITGTSPYGLTDAEPLQWMFANHASQPRRLKELYPTAPDSLDALIDHMLQKLPDQRPSIREVERRLRLMLDGSRPQSGSMGIRQVALLGLLGLALSGGLWVSYTGTVSRSFRWLFDRTMSSPAITGRSLQLDTQALQAPEGMVLIPGATFIMGSTSDDAEAALRLCQQHSSDCSREEFQREAKLRRVTVGSFYLDRTEVTNETYVAWLNKPLRPLRIDAGRIVYTENTKLLDLDEAASGILVRDGHYVPRAGQERKPVVQVTWHGATLYCASDGKRLPTEAEWELAAHGAQPSTAPTPWPWGTELPVCERVTTEREAGGRCQHLGMGPLAVGRSLGDVTPHGVFDLGGNVREWVIDRFAVPYPDCQDCIDPVVTSPLGAGPQIRVVRGGNWLQDQTAARSTWRSRYQEDQVTTALGFRCASPVKG